MNNKKRGQLFKFTVIISLSLLSSSISFAEDLIEACGLNKLDARKQLSLNIEANLKSKFENNVKEKENPLFDFYIRNTTSITKQDTDVALCGTENFKGPNDEICIRLTTKTTNCAKNQLIAQTKYIKENLPGNSRDNRKRAKKWLADINSYRPLYNSLGFEITERKSMDKLIGIENHLLSILNQQFVIFKVVGENIKIVLDDNTRVKPYQNLILSSDTHSYVISSPGTCKVSDSFDPPKTGSKIISWDFNDRQFPIITFKSNVNNVVILAGGDKVKEGGTKTFKRCDADIPYSFTYNGKKKIGTVNLKPGMEKTISKDFTTGALLETAQAYKAGNFWQILYEYVNPTIKNNNIDSLSGIRLGRMTHKDYFRYGVQFAAASDEKESYTLETNLSVKFQLADYDNGTEVLFIGPLVFIPHIGLDIGLAYHSLDGKNSFEDSNDSSSKKFFQSNFLIRPTFGFETTFNKDLALSFRYARGLIMNKSNVISTGLIFRWK